jgi:hypothetical protein
VSGGRAWLEAGVFYAIWWGLATGAFWLFGRAISDPKSLLTCAVMAAVCVVTGELSERWHRRRRAKK